MLRALPDSYFDCVVTSPPYWGLRDYQTATWAGGDAACDHRSPTMKDGRNEDRPTLAGSVATNCDQLLLPHRSACGRCGARKVDQQIGLEPTLGEHLQVLVEVFREVRRVLKAHGTVWLNYGDCYAAAPNGKSAAAYKADGTDDRTFRDKPFSTVGAVYQTDDSERQASRRGRSGNLGNGGVNGAAIPNGRVIAGGFLKPKDLCMIPNRLAIALQDDGWWVRSEIIWHKPNPMPESTYDRPTSAHEKVWLLTKSENYFYNHEAIREPVTASTVSRLSQDVESQAGSLRANGGIRSDRPMKAVGKNSRQNVDRVPASRKRHETQTGVGWGYSEKEQRAVGEVRDTRNARNVWTIAPRAYRDAHFATFPPALAERCMKAGVPALACSFCGHALPQPTCDGACQVTTPVPGRVLDPFGGAGTVGLVAQHLGVDCTLIELNPVYVEMTKRRLGLADVIAEAAE